MLAPNNAAGRTAHRTLMVREARLRDWRLRRMLRAAQWTPDAHLRNARRTGGRAAH